MLRKVRCQLHRVHRQQLQHRRQLRQHRQRRHRTMDQVASSKPKSFIDESFDVPEDYEEELDGYTYAEPKTITYYSKVSEADRRAVVYLPADYDANKEYPIMYLLHGIGGSENEWKSGLPEYITGNLNKEGKIPEMIIVCPNQLVQVPGEKMPGYYLDPGRFVMFNRMVDELRTSLIPYMEENYSIMEGRDNHAIAGLSMGGRTSLYCGFYMLDYFSYIGAFNRHREFFRTMQKTDCLRKILSRYRKSIRTLRSL